MKKMRTLFCWKMLLLGGRLTKSMTTQLKMGDCSSITSRLAQNMLKDEACRVKGKEEISEDSDPPPLSKKTLQIGNLSNMKLMKVRGTHLHEPPKCSEDYKELLHAWIRSTWLVIFYVKQAYEEWNDDLLRKQKVEKSLTLISYKGR